MILDDWTVFDMSILLDKFFSLDCNTSPVLLDKLNCVSSIFTVLFPISFADTILTAKKNNIINMPKRILEKTPKLGKNDIHINIVITIFLSIFFVMIDLIENKTIGQTKEYNDVTNHCKQDIEKTKKETIDIILVDSIYSVLYLFISFSIQFIGTNNKELNVLLYIISIIIYSIVLIVVIHLLVILKRFRIILNYQ